MVENSMNKYEKFKQLKSEAIELSLEMNDIVSNTNIVFFYLKCRDNGMSVAVADWLCELASYTHYL